MNSVQIYCDGACSGNPGPGGWAAMLKYPDGRYRELGGRPGGMASEQFSKIVERDRQDWGDLIRSQKLQLD